MANGMALHTGNPRDFEGIDGLDVVAVTHPDARPDERLLVALPGARAPIGLNLVIGAERTSIDVIGDGRTGCDHSPPIAAAMVVSCDLLPGS